MPKNRITEEGSRPERQRRPHEPEIDRSHSAYRDGRDAHDAGVDFDDCPHPPYPHSRDRGARVSWLSGWLDRHYELKHAPIAERLGITFV